jgi:hypothetical protein
MSLASRETLEIKERACPGTTDNTDRQWAAQQVECGVLGAVQCASV